MKIVIIDYGLGNIFSIQRAIKHLGFEAIISHKLDEISSADKLILPGVGAFGDGMASLQKRKMDKLIIDFAQAKKPILGICLGMQLLLSYSEEFGVHGGLGIIPGKVIRFPEPQPKGLQYKIPHVGWNQVFPLEDKKDIWQKTVLRGVSPGDFVYFVHSFRAIPDNNRFVLAKTEYGGCEFASVIRNENTYGCQFHPELSGNVGLSIYRAFING